MKNTIFVIVVLITLGLGLAALWPSGTLAGGPWTKPFQGHIHSSSILEFGTAKCAPAAKVTIEGSGRASYMGLVTDLQSHCLDLATGAVSDGEYTLTDVNGDTIFGRYGAQAIPTVDCPSPATGDCRSIIAGQYTIDGGTGRYGTVVDGGGPSRGLLNSSTGEAGIFLGGKIVSRGSLGGEY